jgi:hypothetical protein
MQAKSPPNGGLFCADEAMDRYRGDDRNKKSPVLVKSRWIPASARMIETKNPPFGGFFVRSFDLRFFVRHVLPNFGVKLLDLHLVGMQALVLRRRVEVAGASSRNQFDLFAHERSPRALELHALGA